MTTEPRPIGEPVPNWSPPPRPPHQPIDGQYTRLEPLSAAHVPALFSAFDTDETGAMWDYLPTGPYKSLPEFAAWAQSVLSSTDPLFFAVLGEDGTPLGFATLMRITPEAGSIEVGFITFSPSLQRTRSASEAIILLARTAFDLGYRRFEWKCNALNAPSRRAAIRYGFSYEGVFRQSQIAKGRNRDTAWFAMIDKEYPALNAAWTAWLDPSNFDASGQQRQRLADLTAPILAATDPTH